MKKAMFVFGTRPEAIKVAPVIQYIRGNDINIDVVVCVTAQHRTMLYQALEIFSIVPEYDLEIMRSNQDLFDITINALAGLKEVIAKEKPDVIVVQGDTTTAFVAGLAAYYNKIPIAHIEAGLRTYEKYSPFPEEKNRHLLSTLTDFHFAPTETNRLNLIKEGLAEDSIWVTGNTITDALMSITANQKTEEKKNHYKNYFRKTWNLDFDKKHCSMAEHAKHILVTGHRRENFGKKFENICMALKEIAERRSDVDIVYPVHLNPAVQAPVKMILKDTPNIHLIDPLAYDLLVFLMNKSYLVLTDSGGIQEEAPTLGKPVLVMRSTTERPEGIKAGVARLVGTDNDSIVAETLYLLDDKTHYDQMSKARNPYGDGYASKRIVDVIKNRI